MTVVDRPDNGQDEGRKYLAGLRQHSTNPTLLRAVAEVEAELDALTSRRAGAGEQQREQNIETLRPVLLAHHPIMRSETGPFSGCRCGQVGIGQDVIAHVADALLALLGGPQADGQPCTCHLRDEIAGYCPTHEPEPCPSRSHGTDGWHCAVEGLHEQHRNATGDVAW